MARIALIFVTWLAFCAAVSAGEFLAGFDDLPVMPGLSAVKEAGIVFDTPSGRIVEGYAAGAVARQDVQRFYESTLPQLGWAKTGTNEYRREGEKLTMDFKGKDSALTVRFTLSPRMAASRKR